MSGDQGRSPLLTVCLNIAPIITAQIRPPLFEGAILSLSHFTPYRWNTAYDFYRHLLRSRNTRRLIIKIAARMYSQDTYLVLITHNFINDPIGLLSHNTEDYIYNQLRQRWRIILHQRRETARASNPHTRSS